MESLSTIMQEKQSKALKLYGAFFAFGQSQFNEKAIPEIQYVSSYAGLICPKIWVKDLKKELDNIFINAINYQVKTFGAKRIIEYEYFNHETQLGYGIDGLMDAISSHIKMFPELFTPEIIKEVCDNCFQKAVENNWF